MPIYLQKEKDFTQIYLKFSNFIISFTSPYIPTNDPLKQFLIYSIMLACMILTMIVCDVLSWNKRRREES